ncbi:MAG TPA: hypothetical protein VGD99_06330 [Anaerolineae bacterium]|jgi:hypothetical protein
MSDQLRQAIALAKSGQKQDAQQLLLKIIAAEPTNEQAWLWMSAVISADKKRYCIERALKINPNNPHAQQALAKLKQLEPKPPPADRPAAASPPLAKLPPSSKPGVQPLSPKLANLPHPTSTSTPSRTPSPPSQSASSKTKLDRSIPEFWLNRERNVLYITVLLINDLISATIPPGQAKQMQVELQRGNVPLDLLSDKKVIPFHAITQVKQTADSIRVYYIEASVSKSTLLSCDDEVMAEAIVMALQKRLEPGFERTSAPMSLGTIMGFGLISTIIILAASVFCYYGAAEVAAGDLSSRGSARTRTFVALLGLLGPNGVACLGGIVLVLVLASVGYSLVKPSLVTRLLPKETTRS